MYVKSLLITGANRGIGLEFVKQFLKLPQSPQWVFAACRNPEKATDLKTLGETYPNLRIKQLEVTDRESIKDLVTSVTSDLGEEGLTLLINNAGCLKRLQLNDVTQEEMLESFQINSVAPLCISQAFVPVLKKSSLQSPGDGGYGYRAAIVNISTLTASITDNVTGGNYDSRTSKAALNMISKSLSVDLKPGRILVSILDPGWVKTELGGAGAKMEVSDSVARMIKVIQGLTMDKTGTFLNYDGKTLPW
ncbi:C-signal-like [Liolophura sinensis]|uniref:C-signal-like n=1 Tax=Liolophura sinensis TaxID=3198878 RepID=UPI0031584510